jgi:hypothetical protein
MAATASPVIELWNDIENNVLVLGLNNAGTVELNKRKIYQGSKLCLRWYPVKPTNNRTAPFFVKVPLDGLTLDIGIGPRAGAEALLARQNVWAPNNQEGCLEATLNLNTSEMNNALGSSDSLSTYFEIVLSVNGDDRPVYQEAITVLPRVVGPAGSSNLPTAAVEYLTAAQIRAEFVRWTDNPPGLALELTSPDGTRIRYLGVRNNGSHSDETT